MQERTARPSMCTVHAPHMPMPQPNFVPLSPISSRMTHRSRCVLGNIDRNGLVIEFEGGHDRAAPNGFLIVTPLVPCGLPPLCSRCSSRLEVLCACAAHMQPTVQCR